MDLSPDFAFNVGLFAGWMALVVWLVWPSKHSCHDTQCERDKRDRESWTK